MDPAPGQAYDDRRHPLTASNFFSAGGGRCSLTDMAVYVCLGRGRPRLPGPLPLAGSGRNVYVGLVDETKQINGGIDACFLGTALP